MNDFVVVAIFNNQRETMNLRSVLERKKIPYIIQDETTVAAAWEKAMKDVLEVKTILKELKKEKFLID